MDNYDCLSTNIRYVKILNIAVTDINQPKKTIEITDNNKEKAIDKILHALNVK